MSDQPPTSSDDIALLVGQVCLEWADLENEVTNFAVVVAFLPSERPIFSLETEALSIAMSFMEMRQKVATAKALSHLGDHVFQTYDRAEPLLNRIDNDLRNERNRYVHDDWLAIPNHPIMRIKSGAKVVRPQSRERVLYYRTTKDFENIEEVAELVESLRDVEAELFKLRREVEEFLKKKGLLE